MILEKKLVAIINESTPIGVAMNALAHASLSLGANSKIDELYIKEYKDKDDNIWPMSGMPYIILKSKQSEMKKIAHAAKEKNIKMFIFTEEMTGCTWIEQCEKIKHTNFDNHIYFVIILFDDNVKVKELTKRLSLYK